MLDRPLYIATPPWSRSSTLRVLPEPTYVPSEGGGGCLLEQVGQQVVNKAVEQQQEEYQVRQSQGTVEYDSYVRIKLWLGRYQMLQLWLCLSSTVAVAMSVKYCSCGYVNAMHVSMSMSLLTIANVPTQCPISWNVHITNKLYVYELYNGLCSHYRRLQNAQLQINRSVVIC